jgi:two-component system response regulator (stage 0 sporulation protein F)
VATTVAEALALLKNGPESVVLDLMLPDGDGVTVLRAVRQMGLAARVVVATGAGDADYLQTARDLQPAALLQKPVRLPELIAALKGHA